MSVASPSRAAFPGSQAGRHPRLHFRGLLRLHSNYGPLDRSTAQGGLCHRASIHPVTRTNRLPATRSNRQLSGWFLPPLVIRAFWAHCDIRGKEAEAEHPGEVGVAQTGGCRHLRHRPATAREDGLQFMGPRNPFQQAGIHLVSRSRVRALDQEPLYPFPSVSIAPRSSIPGPAARVWTTVRGRRRRHRLADDPPDPSCEWRSPGSPGAR